MELASLPLEGSVKQNAAKTSPVATFGKYFFFCSSFPNKVMPYITKQIATIKLTSI